MAIRWCKSLRICLLVLHNTRTGGQTARDGITSRVKNSSCDFTIAQRSVSVSGRQLEGR